MSELLNLAPTMPRGKEFLSLVMWPEKSTALILSLPHLTLFDACSCIERNSKK